jgi:hypothetical protein
MQTGVENRFHELVAELYEVRELTDGYDALMMCRARH